MPATSEQLQRALNHCLIETHFTGMGERYHGKVRDTYATPDNRLVLITTDRISAFDHVLRQPIPFKGQVLNQLAAFFFERTADVVENHIIAVPDPNVTVAHRCEALPVEFVVRGYLAGHAWRTYRSGERVLCGKPLAEGLRQNSRLPESILTPTTKATHGHDEDITREEIIRQGLLPADLFDEIEAIALALFERGTAMAAARGLILVDTKYEFGRTADGRIVLIDEVHTPDSSRYFYADSYDTLLARNEPQRQLSKEFVREWLMAAGFQGKAGQDMPDLPDAFRMDASRRYIELFESITGLDFDPATSENPEDRIREALRSVEA